MTFGLLGVLLEGSFSNRHRLPSHTTVPQPVFNRHQIDLRPLFATATLPTGTPVSSRRAEQSNNLSKTGLKPDLDRSSTRRPCPQVLQSHPRVAKGAHGRSSARRPCLQVLQSHPGVAKGTSVDPLARGPSTEYSCGRSTWQDCLEPVSNRSLADA